MPLLPYFRWFPADAKDDEIYASLSLEELGLYHAIIDHAWGNSGIPADPKKAAAAIGRGITPARWMKLWPAISGRFYEKDGRFFEKRQEREREIALTKSLKNQRNGNANAKRTERDRDAFASQRAYGSGYESDSSSVDKTSEEEESKAHASVVELKYEKSDNWFEEKFWPLWPVKENKLKAKRAAAKLKEADREAALAGLVEQAFRIKAMERPIHAATWLNDERWNDEKHKPGAREPTLFSNLAPSKESFAAGVVRRAQERIMRGESPL